MITLLYNKRISGSTSAFKNIEEFSLRLSLQTIDGSEVRGLVLVV